MYTMMEKVGGRFSKQYCSILAVANHSEEKKAQVKAWTAAEMDRFHMEAHKDDMMRGFTGPQRNKAVLQSLKGGR